MKKLFASVEIGRVLYEIGTSDAGEVSFRAVSRYPEELGIVDDSWDMPDTYVSYTSHGACKDPIKVVRAIGEVISRWVERAEPPYFFFRAVDPKKVKMYMRLARRSPAFEKYYCYCALDEESGVEIVHFVRI